MQFSWKIGPKNDKKSPPSQASRTQWKANLQPMCHLEGGKMIVLHFALDKN